MSAGLMANPYVVSGGLVAVATLGAAVVSAWESRQSRKEAKHSRTIVQGNGKGNVGQMVEMVLEDVQYIRERLDTHIDNRAIHK